MRPLLRSLIHALPQSSRALLYRYCKTYVEHYEGANDPDISQNGELRILRKLIPQCKEVFDVGANVGEWATLVLQQNPAVRLHCFEPSRSTFAKLAANRFQGNVLCHNFGLGSGNRPAKLFVFDEGSALNSLYRRRGLEHMGLLPPEKEETIQLRTLDDYCAEHQIHEIDYVKLDVEGHELEVLRGAEDMLRQGRIGVIQFEYGGCNIDSKVFLKDLFDFVQDLSYEFYKILPDRLHRVPVYSQQFENFQYSNWLLIRKGSDPVDRIIQGNHRY